jgi:uncharacterized protein YkwD
MKILSNILIGLCAVLSLVVLREDIFKAYDTAVFYIEGKSLPAEQVATTSTQTDQNTIDEKPSVATSKQPAKTPGALKVIDTFITSDINSIDLTPHRVIDWTNINRLEVAGLPALKENATLDATAAKKVKDMFANQYFEHTSPSGVGVSDLANEAGYEYVTIGENLALGNFKDEKNLLDAWMASPGHRANILNAHYTDIGVAVGRGTFNGEDTWLAVQHFGTPRDLCPAIDGTLKSKVQLEQTELNKESAELQKRQDQISQGGIFNGLTNSEQINEYNNAVATYNNLLKEEKVILAEYNSQIHIFNDCVATMTSKITH